MADFSTAASSAESALNGIAAGGLVESYSITNGGRSVSMTPLRDLVNALPRLNGLAARAAGCGLVRLGKPQEPVE